MKKIIKFTKLIILFIFTIFIIISSFYIYAIITPKTNINTNDSIIYYDKNENNIFEYNNNNYVELKNISQHVLNSIISIEDKNFYKHKGFDCLRIIKAMLINLKSGKIKQGASTISQQYIKNLYLTFDKTWERKIEEAFLTIELESHYTKNEILEGYLNTIDFGAGNYGIRNASKYYFNKEPKELTLEEATLIVGIPRNPSYYNPITNYEAAKKRQKEILISMYKNNYIKKEDIEKIYNKKVEFHGIYEKKELTSIYYYKDAILKELETIENIPKSLTEIKKLNIYTNLDIDVQKELEKNINNEMKDTTLQVASIVIEPKNGKIVALIGGKDYSKSQFNRATSSKRQVGSTIKPLLYYNALENGFTASSTFLSERTTFNLGNETYSPKNANNIYANENITMLAAIAYSDNIYAMKTHLFLGIDMLTTLAKKLYINSEIKEVASSALGTSEINIIDYSNAFITLANEGKHETPHIIEKITDEKGKIIYEYKYKNEYILNKNNVFILNNLLTSTYNYKMVNYTSPTLLSVSNELDSNYSVKSGSTSTDYWTIGYNNNYLVMVWTGNDNNSKVENKDAKITKRIWAKTITNIKTNSKKWYETPKKLTISTINPISGKIDENGIPCYFVKGTEPNFEFIEYYENISNKNTSNQ